MISTLFLVLAGFSADARADSINHAIIHAGYGGVFLDGAPLGGFNAGLQYRSSSGGFAFDAEPVSITYDNFGSTTGLRVSFLSPGVRGILFPERAVSPSLGVAVGFNYTGINDADTGLDFGTLQFDGRASAAVEFWRASGKVHPTIEVQYVIPLASISNFANRQPHAFMARLSLAFETRISAADLVERWLF